MSPRVVLYKGHPKNKTFSTAIPLLSKQFSDVYLARDETAPAPAAAVSRFPAAYPLARDVPVSKPSGPGALTGRAARTHPQKLVARLADDGEAVPQDVGGPPRRDVAVGWRHRGRAGQSCGGSRAVGSGRPTAGEPELSLRHPRFIDGTLDGDRELAPANLRAAWPAN